MNYKLSQELTDAEFHQLISKREADLLKETVLAVPPKLRDSFGVTKELLTLAKTTLGSAKNSRANKTILMEWRVNLSTNSWIYCKVCGNHEYVPYHDGPIDVVEFHYTEWNRDLAPCKGSFKAPKIRKGV